ncbi:Gfo/Idh/MocA family oxidoreductase [Candidatus Bathyarchaeota archaeon]|nr:Gfo/Idh/MocA family oxidoreductase [Candidatus Bathyarchaeota archaeon]
MRRLGIIGCGRVTTMFHLKAIDISKKWKIVGLADNDENRLKEVQKLSKAEYITKDYRDLLKREDIDAVAINTPPKLHEQMVIDALNQNKHVLCEKPLAQTIDSCLKIKQKKEETDLVVLPVHNYIFSPGFVKLVEKYKEHTIGDLKNILITFENNLQIYDPKTNFRILENKGIIEDIMPHILSVIIVLAGNVNNIKDVSWWCKNFEVCDNMKVSLITESGIEAKCSLSWTKLIPQFKIIVEGSSGKLKTELMLEPYKYTMEKGKQSYTESERGLDWYLDLIQFKHPSFSELYKYLAELISGNTNPKITIDDEINMIKIIEKMSGEIIPERRLLNV